MGGLMKKNLNADKSKVINHTLQKLFFIIFSSRTADLLQISNNFFANFYNLSNVHDYVQRSVLIHKSVNELRVSI